MIHVVLSSLNVLSGYGYYKRIELNFCEMKFSLNFWGSFDHWDSLQTHTKNESTKLILVVRLWPNTCFPLCVYVCVFIDCLWVWVCVLCVSVCAVCVWVCVLCVWVCVLRVCRVCAYVCSTEYYRRDNLFRFQFPFSDLKFASHKQMKYMLLNKRSRWPTVSKLWNNPDMAIKHSN